MPPLSAIYAWVPAWLYALCLFIVIMAVGLWLQALLTRFLTNHPTWHPFVKQAWSRTRRLVRFMLALFAAGMAVQTLSLSSQQIDIARRIFLCLFIIQMGWIALAVANI